MNLLITGGAGFIGSHFLELEILKLSSEIESITVIDSLTYASNLKNIEAFIGIKNFRFIERDICDIGEANSVFDRVDAIVHFAAESHVDKSISNSAKFMRTNVLGTETLLRMAITFGIKKFIHISTDEVYGTIEDGSWDENCALQPNSPYAASKASSDLVVRAFHKTYGLHTNITRCTNNFGQRQHPEKLIPLIISNILAGKEIPLYGEGTNTRDWLSVKDHCKAIDLILFNGAYGETYNIGGGKELSNLALVEFIISLMGANRNLIKFVEDRKGHDFRYSLNFDKIATHLGYAPSFDFEASLIESIGWYKSNADWWN